MHVTSITLRFASFCLFFLTSIQSIEKMVNDKSEPLLLLSLAHVERDLGNNTYIENVLPYNFSYVAMLLDHGNKSKQDRSYHQSVLRLFTNLFKKTPCINAYGFDDCIVQLPKLLKDQMESTLVQTMLHQMHLRDLDVIHKFQAAVNGLLFQSLSTQYDIFKKNPGQFLNTVSETITSIAQEEIAIEQLRTAVVRYLETGLSKCAWGNDNFEASWKNIKSLSEHLAQLLESKIIDDPYDLDDIYWSLLTRYCYFLKIHATLIPFEFYEILEKDLDSHVPALLSLEEQELFIETKSHYFRRTLMECKAKYSAFQRGILMS